MSLSGKAMFLRDIELVCQFCCKKYYFDKEHLQRILAEMKKRKTTSPIRF